MKDLSDRFTASQAIYASEAMCNLMRKYRYTLGNPLKGYPRDSAAFGPILDLHRQILESSEIAARVAEGYIKSFDSELGIAPPNLKEGQRVVRVSRYGEGLDISDAWPLAFLARDIPNSFGELKSEVGKLDPGNITAVQSSDLVRDIWEQLGKMEAWNPENLRVVVLLKTCFIPSVHDGLPPDFMDGKLADLQAYPKALGYLFHRRSMKNRLMPHGYTVFSTGSLSHVSIKHFDHNWPRIRFHDSGGGYNNKIHFATVL